MPETASAEIHMLRTIVLVGLADCALREALLALQEKRDHICLECSYQDAHEYLRGKGVDLAIFGVSSDANCDQLARIVTALGPETISTVATPEDAREWILLAAESGVDHYLFETAGEEHANIFLDLVLVRRRRRQLQLRRERASHSLLAAIPDVVIVFDREGRYQEAIASSNGEERYMRPSDELLGHRVSEFFRPEEAKIATDTVHEVLRTRSKKIINYKLTIRGEERWFAGHVAPLDPDDNEHVIWVARDITDQHLAERKAAETAHILQTVLDSLPLGIFWKDQEYRFLGMNRYTSNAIGADSPEVAIGKTDEDFANTQGEAAHFREFDRRVMDSGEPVLGILEKIDQPEGEPIWLRTNKVPLKDERGEVFGILGSFEDISEERKKALAHARDRDSLNAAQALAKLGSWETNLETHVTVWSDELYRIHDLEVGARRFGADDVDHIYLIPEDAAAVRKAYTACYQDGTPFELIAQLTSAKGNVRMVRQIAQRVSPTLIRGSVQDITEMYEQRIALQNSQAFLKSLLDNLPIGVYWKDCNSRFLGANRAFLKQAGVKDVNSIVGRTDGDNGVPQTVADEFAIEDRELCAGGDPIFARIYNIKLPNLPPMWLRGSKVPLLNANGEIVGVLGTSEDITEARHHDLERTRNQALLRSTQQLSKIGGWEVDVDQNQIYWTDEMYGIFEVDPEVSPTLELALSFWSPEEQARFVPLLQDCIEKGLPYEVETIITTADGKEKWTRSTARLVRGDNHSSTRVVGTFQDISEERRRKVEQLAFEARVQHAQKLESLGVLAGGIAHDFNNLLVSMMGYASMALGLTPEGSPAYDKISNVVEAAKKAADLTKQMLAYSGKGKFVIEEVALNDLVAEMGNILRVTLPKGVILKENYAPNLPRISADKAQISQIVMNLITNAGEAIGARSGIVTVSTSVVDAGREYLAGSEWDHQLEPGYYVSLEVADTGQGMDDETRARIFDPFFTTKFTGRGLGLAAVLGIVRGHKGAIRVYSEGGRGTTFKVLLPVSTKARGGEATPRTTISAQALRGFALVVDDEESVRAVAKMILEDAGMTVDTANDGRDGVEKFSADPDRYALVILDMTMPHMNGPQAFKEIRKLRPDACVMLSSGYTEQDATASFAGKGLSGFIQKPYLPIELVKAVRKAIGTTWEFDEEE